MTLVTPAILASSQTDLEEKIARFTMVPAVRRIQIDVVDGRFASPASWPFTAITEFRQLLAHGKSLPHTGRFEYEIDLMINEPENAAGAFLKIGATRLVLHAESTTSLARLLAIIRRQSGHEKSFVPDMVSLGLALNIGTDLALLEPYLDQIDFVQLMGIAHIGVQGQSFDRRVIKKVRSFREKHPEMPLQIDGGVTLHIAGELIGLGVSNLVVGHDLLESADIAAEIRRFDALASDYGV